MEIVNTSICNSVVHALKKLELESSASRATKHGITKDYQLLNKKLICKENKRENASLKITIDKSSGFVKIEGSLRKWYFGKNTLLDFKSRKQFKIAISLLAKELRISIHDIQRMAIKRLDIGYNLRFRTNFAFNLFMNNDIERRVGNVKYYGTGFDFVCQQYKTTMYNKLLEMNKRGNRFNGAKILAKQMSIVRAELQLKSVTIIENKLKGVCNLFGVYKQWNELQKVWSKCILEMKFEIGNNEILINPEQIKCSKDITKWIRAVGITTVGLGRIKAFADYSKTIKPSPKSRYLKGLRLLVADFVCKKSNEVEEFKDKISNLNNIHKDILKKYI